MMSQQKNHFIALGFVLFFAAIIPLTVYLTQQQQNTRSKAGAATTLTFTPASSSTTPLQKNTNDTIALDLMVNPGNNLPSLIKVAVNYDPAILEASTASVFSPNTNAFPIIIEGPVVTNGKVYVTVSIGSDATKAVQTITKVGTFTFKAIAPTTTSPTIVSIDNISQVLSVASSDRATENVLASTVPGYITISGSSTVTPSPTVSIAPSPTPTPLPNTTTLPLQVFMHGIGNSGDNANPTSHSLSNKTPQHPTKGVSVFIYNSSNLLAASASGFIIYASQSGNFTGTINIANLPQDAYTVKIMSPLHLRKLVDGIQTFSQNQSNTLPPVTLVTGDVDNNNALNILDYNTIIGCYSDLTPAVSCNDTTKLNSDLNDDNLVNQFDYNLFLREITVQNGD